MSNEASTIGLNVITGHNSFNANVEADNTLLVNASQDHEQPSALPALVSRPPNQLAPGSVLLLTLRYWWSGLGNVIKTQSRYLQHFRLFLT